MVHDHCMYHFRNITSFNQNRYFLYQNVLPTFQCLLYMKNQQEKKYKCLKNLKRTFWFIESCVLYHNVFTIYLLVTNKYLKNQQPYQTNEKLTKFTGLSVTRTQRGENSKTIHQSFSNFVVSKYGYSSTVSSCQALKLSP